VARAVLVRKRVEIAMTIRERPGSKVLLVDDDPQQLLMGAFEMEEYGWSVATARSPIEAIAMMAEETVDLAILDYNMPMMNGCALADRLKSISPDLTIILHCGATNIPRWEMSAVDACIPKDDGLTRFLPQLIELVQNPIGSYTPEVPETGSSVLERGAHS
jgi:CheY-like chemotaxis protein